MSDTMTCPCGATIDAARYVCERCTERLEYDLADIASLWGDLGPVHTKQVNYGTGGKRTDPSPLPIDSRFTPHREKATGKLARGHGWEVEATIKQRVVSWAQYVGEWLVPIDGPVCHRCSHRLCVTIRQRRTPADTVPAIATYLLIHAEWLCRTDLAGDVCDEIAESAEELRRLVDLPADQWYAGICSAPINDSETCDRELYATKRRGILTCGKCQARHDIEDRRKFLLSEARTYLVSATEAARAVVMWADSTKGEDTLVKRIHAWDKRGRLQAVQHETRAGRSRPLYRLGDVLGLLEGEMAARAREKATA